MGGDDVSILFVGPWETPDVDYMMENKFFLIRKLIIDVPGNYHRNCAVVRKFENDYSWFIKIMPGSDWKWSEEIFGNTLEQAQRGADDLMRNVGYLLVDQKYSVMI